jgi:23S rRNA pseudouridine955/2504/2580 synthase
MRPNQSGRELIAGPDDAGRRLDRILRALLKDESLSEIYSALRKGRIKVNGRRAEPESRLEAGDLIQLLDKAPLERTEAGEPSENIDGLEELADVLILATNDLLFINKPRGELAQSPDGLESRVRKALASRSSASLSFSPGPLHRLDRNTTGILTYPRTAAGARAFSALIRERGLTKNYLALLEGEGAEGGEWRDKIGRDEASLVSAVSAEGSLAEAFMRPLLVYGGYTLALVELRSGITHQIRVQASSRGFPLAGDAKYGGQPFRGGYILHALSIGFPVPPFPDLPPIVVAPLPDGARSRLASLFGAAALDSALESALPSQSER